MSEPEIGKIRTLSRRLPRLGVLGASRIVRGALVDEAHDLVEVSAVAARDLARAETFAQQHEIPRAFGSYEELICDPDIDVIYNALPASGHAPWSERALQNGKHVLCEKPFGLHADEARRLVRLARDKQLLLMEAHHTRFHPLAARVEEVLSGLELSDSVFEVEARFFGSLNNPGDIRLNPLLGPGVLMDFGCYTINWCVWLVRSLCGRAAAGVPYVRTSEIVEGQPGVDLAAEVEMGFEGAVHPDSRIQFACEMRDGTPFRAYVRLSLADFVLHFENPLGIFGSYLSVIRASKEERFLPEGPTTYGGQLRAFVRALRTGQAPPNTGNDIIETQSLLDSCYDKAGVIGRRELRERALQASNSS